MIARDSFYGSESPIASFEHTDTYLKTGFAFIGLNAEVIVAEGIAAAARSSDRSGAPSPTVMAASAWMATTKRGLVGTRPILSMMGNDHGDSSLDRQTAFQAPLLQKSTRRCSCRNPDRALAVAGGSLYYSIASIDFPDGRRLKLIDAISLGQLRAFIAVVNEGSFSSAARALRRTQSAVSESIANLEAQLSVVLFDRTGRYPRLTPEGAVLIADARAVATALDELRARAKGMAGGLEPELIAVIDVFVPIDVVADVAEQFGVAFPSTPLRLYVEALGSAVQPVLDGRAGFALVGSLPVRPPDITAERIADVKLLMVAAAAHPLAAHRGMIPPEELARHTQLVLTDRSSLSDGQQFGVMALSTWRLADLAAKHAFLLRGLGWGGMPYHVVKQDLEDGRLVELSIQNVPRGGVTLPMSAIYRASDPPGPAGRWMIERLKHCAQNAE